MSLALAYKIEACVESFVQAVTAFSRGADRLEICSRLETAGMTPAPDLVKNILGSVTIPVRVMIRETEKGFEADPAHLQKMKKAILEFQSLRLGGFVIGILKNNRLDREAMAQVISACAPFSVTIHKALDLSQDIESDIRWLNQFSNVDTILTSGGKETALEGKPGILKMKSWFKGDTMAGGKILFADLPGLHEQLHLNWYHGRNITPAPIL